VDHLLFLVEKDQQLRAAQIIQIVLLRDGVMMVVMDIMDLMCLDKEVVAAVVLELLVVMLLLQIVVGMVVMD
jgi:hypothetical protein